MGSSTRGVGSTSSSMLLAGGIVSYFHEMTYETWMSQIDRNLNSVFTVTRAVLPAMLAQKSGRIINISSVAAVKGGRLVRGATAYAAAKAGVVGLTKALAIEVAEQGVTVNCLVPGARTLPGGRRTRPNAVSNCSRGSRHAYSDDQNTWRRQ